MTSDNYNYAEVVVAALIVNKDKKILLIKSHKWGDIYLLPGGHVELGETILEAARREGEEETGLKLKPLYCVNTGELINDPAFYRKAHLVYFHIVCEALTEEVKLDNKELQEFFWKSPEEAIKLASLGIGKSIENYINGVKVEIGSYVY